MNTLHLLKLSAPTDLELRYLYVLGAQATSVEILALEAPGQSKLIASVDVMGPARAAGVEISEFIYVSPIRPRLQILTSRLRIVSCSQHPRDGDLCSSVKEASARAFRDVSLIL